LLLRQAAGAADHARGLSEFLTSLNTPSPAGAPGQRRVAVVGSGIAGLSAAWALSRHAEVTLFEAGDYFGGHTHTVDINLLGQQHGVDTGFLVFNERTYPLLIQLFAQLCVEVAASDMSFSVQVPELALEWSGSNLNSVFAQRRNLLRPAFWGMLQDLLRFNRLCTELAERGSEAALSQSIGDFLGEQRFGEAFRHWYLLPMVACIWSCPTSQMLQFPIRTLIRFCHNHGLLQVTQRPQWFTVRGGARNYVDKLLPQIRHKRLNCAVHAVQRGGAQLTVHSSAGTEQFDEVVMASHSDQSLALLGNASLQERQILGSIGYHRNRAVLHTDASLLPQRRRAWAAWNYEHGGSAGQQGREDQAVCLHYLLNRLQPLPWQQPVLVSLNPVREPDAAQVLGEFDYAHPVFDLPAVRAQARLPEIQGRDHLWYCGAWTRYGFHEDGLLSGLGVAQRMLQHWSTHAPAGATP
jgi:predicted NAD/FAD-binding protein